MAALLKRGLLLTSLAAAALAGEVKDEPVEVHETGQCSWTAHGSPYPLVPKNTCPGLTNELTAFRKKEWPPWTHMPYCLVPTDIGNPQYCLYTDLSFRGGRGLSILTTADVAASVAGALDDSLVAPGVRDHPSLSEPAAAAAADVAYRIQDLPGRGKGVVARRRISKWEVIMVEHPAVISLNDIHAASEAEAEGLLNMAVRRLPAPQQDRVMALARTMGGDPVRDILRTNVFSLDVNGISHIGLFPSSSRLNHHCMPNTFWRYSSQNMAQEIVALHDIEAGEEITHSYTDLGLSHRERQEAIAAWRFNCTCSLCTAPPREIEASDGRRGRLIQLHADLTSFSVDAKRISEMADELLYLVDREHLWTLLCEYYQVIAGAYMMRGDLESAGRYIDLANEAGVLYGVDSDSMESIAELRKQWNKSRGT